MKKYSGQRFTYYFNIIFKLLDLLSDSSLEKKSNKDVSKYLGIGVPKVQAFINYAELSDLVRDRKLTNFGEHILKLKDYPEIYKPLLYYKMCRGWENGGHFYYSRIVNNILYEKYFSPDNSITTAEVREKLLEFRNEYENLDLKLVSTAMNGLSSSEGFGQIGLVQKEAKKGRSNNFSIHSYRPHYLICAYVIYDRWPQNEGTVSFDYITSGEYNLGRLFFLNRDEISIIFSKLQQEGYIKVEDKAGLGQIVKNPELDINKILEAIRNEF